MGLERSDVVRIKLIVMDREGGGGLEKEMIKGVWFLETRGERKG